MITLFIHFSWTNQNLSGILNWRQLPWCQLMKKFLESAGKDFGSEPKWVSPTMVHTFWNHSLQNLNELDKNHSYHDKKMFTSIRLNWLFSSGSNQTILLVASDGNYCRLFPASSTFWHNSEEFKDNIVYSPTSYCLLRLLQRQPSKLRSIRRRLWRTKEQLARQLFKQKLPSSLELRFE